MPIRKKRLQTLKVDFFGKIVWFAAPKKPKKRRFINEQSRDKYEMSNLNAFRHFINGLPKLLKYCYFERLIVLHCIGKLEFPFFISGS